MRWKEVWANGALLVVTTVVSVGFYPVLADG